MNVLHAVESRFPLTRGRVRPDTDGATEIDTGGPAEGRRPFGMRFFVAQTTPSAEPAFDYSEDQQVTVDENDHPVVRGPSAGWSRTTTGNMDGNEETKMDQDPDSD